MNLSSTKPAPAPAQTLRRLFLTLFLRGRSARGLTKKSAPTSVGRKLLFTLLFYALFGCLAFSLARQPVFVLSVYLHAMTFVFLGMFVAASAGEILFNKEEADILLHRPITPRSMLWAKVRVLVEVSLWLAGAFNLVGFFVGWFGPNGSWRFPAVHLVSTTLEALFCASSVVLVYQLCLRWFGRDRLDGLMVMAQVIISVAAVLSGQILPRIVMTAENFAGAGKIAWWIGLLPPAWFAGLDDALAGSGSRGSWLLAALAVVGTALVLWLAFEKLAHGYETGLQSLHETVSTPTRAGNRRRWIDVLVDQPPLSWWLRDPVTRTSFLLTAAYLARDRDVKLRVYPALAPFLIMPLIFLVGRHGDDGFGNGFGIAFASGYMGFVPLLGVSMIRYSQQWQASDIFRAAPIAGPAPLCDGARRAVLCILTFPLLVLFIILTYALSRDKSQLLLLLPGIIALPVFALLPCLGGQAVPLSLPSDEAKSAGRGLLLIAVIPIAMANSALAAWSWSSGWFWWVIVVESVVALGLHVVMSRSVSKARWPSME